MEFLAILFPILILVIEFFLGNTKMVKENSLISVILEAAKAILVHFKDAPKKEEVKEEVEVKVEVKEEV